MSGSVPTVSLFLALLAVVAEVVTFGVLALAGGSILPGSVGVSARRGLAAVRAEVGPHARWLAATVALVCTLGSLYFSEIAHFQPCRLCWYQRYCMYPLVPVLGAAHLWRARPWSRALVLAGMVLAGIGISISTWHVLLERFPSLESSQTCDLSNPCSLIWVERLGYLTIPAMAWSGFALILTLLALDWRTPHGNP